MTIHPCYLGRKRFGPLGWSQHYNFNIQDLTASTSITSMYLDQEERVPWEALRYIIGQVMYGGHITDTWDRRVANTYLQTWMQQRSDQINK